jgi:hypothetical protein
MKACDVPVEKTPEPWPPITNESTSTAHSATVSKARGWRTGHRNPRADEAQRGDFLTQTRKFTPFGNRTWDMRCATRSP